LHRAFLPTPPYPPRGILPCKLMSLIRRVVLR
jgi:hypothetical protein